jgi:hypothetical protein
MILLMTRRREFFLVVALLLIGCRGQQGLHGDHSDAGRLAQQYTVTMKSDALPAPTWADLEKMPKLLMAEPGIYVTAEGTAQALKLRFRMRPFLPGGANTSIPLINRITIEKFQKPRRRGAPECLVKADGPVGMREWRYGDTSPGFERFGCEKLPPGEYVVSVQMLGGYGGIGMTVDEKGTVTPHPLPGSTEPLWDGK